MEWGEGELGAQWVRRVLLKVFRHKGGKAHKKVVLKVSIP